MKLKFVKKRKENEEITTFFFEPESRIRYIAGQYTELTIPHESPDSRNTKRWFTLSSSPTEEFWSITTRLNRKGSSFKKALVRLNPGDHIHGHLPMGDFVLPKDEALPLIFIAKGIGITPYRSILKYLEDTGQSRQIHLIYAVKNLSDAIFTRLLEKKSVTLSLHPGRLRASDLTAYAGNAEERLVYISGPEHMVEDLQKELIASGMNELRIRTDFFHNYD